MQQKGKKKNIRELVGGWRSFPYFLPFTFDLIFLYNAAAQNPE